MPVAPPRYHWNQKHSVNVEQLDDQHRNLYETMNQLDLALQNGKADATIKSIMDKLVDYAVTHFAAEEAVMEQHGFPGLAEHRKAHAMFRQKLAGLVIDHRAGEAGVAAELLSFMDAWLRKHLVEMDQQYAKFLAARAAR